MTTVAEEGGSRGLCPRRPPLVSHLIVSHPGDVYYGPLLPSPHHMTLHWRTEMAQTKPKETKTLCDVLSLHRDVPGQRAMRPRGAMEIEPCLLHFYCSRQPLSLSICLREFLSSRVFRFSSEMEKNRFPSTLFHLNQLFHRYSYSEWTWRNSEHNDEFVRFLIVIPANDIIQKNELPCS